jgi:hypothetical protein
MTPCEVPADPPFGPALEAGEANEDAPCVRGHYTNVAIEAVKIVSLITAVALLLAAWSAMARRPRIHEIRMRRCEEYGLPTVAP